MQHKGFASIILHYNLQYTAKKRDFNTCVKMKAFGESNVLK